MVIGSFYNTAKNYAEKVRQERPAFYTQPDGAICLIIAEDQEIFTGVTSIRISEGNVVPVHAEANAIMSMIAANKPKAKQMVTFSFKDASVIKPCDECLDMLLHADDENSRCEIVLSPDSSDTAINLKAAVTSVSAEFLENKCDSNDSTELGAPAEFVSGFEFDADNPFLDAGFNEPVSEVKTIQDNVQQQVPMQGGFVQQQMPMQGGFVQQQMPMQGGFVQQQTPMQGGFAQQQVPMQGGFAQQQVPMQGGFVQQQMPMQGGYAQQQMPMQGGFAQQQMSMQGGFAQQQMPMQGGFAQQPNAGYARGTEKSEYISDVISTAAAGQYQPSPAASKYAVPGEEGGILKQRLASIFNEDEDEDGVNSATMSKEDLKRQSKEMKKVAKMNAQFKKQF